LVLGQGSTGASNDLTGATQLATRMVVEFGLSPQLGPVSYTSGSPGYLGTGPDGVGRPYSEATQRVVDQEVARLLREAEQTAMELLRTHRPALDRLTEQLLAEETVDGSVVLATLRDTAMPPRQPTPTR
jgi:cell division protease FtsH